MIRRNAIRMSVPIGSRRAIRLRVFCALAAMGSWAISVASAQTESPDASPSTPSDAEAPGVEELIQRAADALDRISPASAREDRDALLVTVQGALDRIRDLDPDNPWLTYLLGRSLIAEGRRRDAISQLERFVESRVGRNEWRALRLLGDLFVDEFPRLARQHYRRAADLTVDEPSVLFGLSRCADQLGDEDEAIRLAHKAVDADKRHTVAYLDHLAKLTARRGDWAAASQAAAEAVAVAEADLRARPGQPEPLAAIDKQYQLLIKIEEGRIRTLRDRAAIADGCLRLVDAIHRRADMMSRLARHDALRVLRTAVERIQPDPPIELLEAYGITLAEVEQIDRAIEAFEQVLATDPNNSLAASWLERLRARRSESASPNP